MQTDRTTHITDIASEEVTTGLRLATSWAQLCRRKHQMLKGSNGMEIFLQHVLASVPYYRRYFHNKASRPIFDDFPLISRHEYDSQRRQFLSENVALESHHYSTTSSGTTGSPITVCFDFGSWYELNYFTYRLVAETVPGLLTLFLPQKTGVVMVSSKPTTEDILRIIPCLNDALFRKFRIYGSIAEDATLIRYLRKHCIPLLYGKPHYLLQLEEADQELGQKEKIRPVSILVSGENLYDDQRYKLESWFGCPVYNAYISSEGGFIAIDCFQHKGLHLQTQRVKVEILKNSGELRNDGSGEIVVTNITNWATTFVRYRSGDYGTIRIGSCSCGYSGPTLMDLRAYEPSFFRIGSRQVDPRLLDEMFLELPVRQFQIIQKSSSVFEIKWVPIRGDVNVRSTECMIRDRFCKRIDSTVVQVSTVNHITEPGGKMRRYVRVKDEE